MPLEKYEGPEAWKNTARRYHVLIDDDDNPAVKHQRGEVIADNPTDAMTEARNMPHVQAAIEAHRKVSCGDLGLLYVPKHQRWIPPEER